MRILGKLAILFPVDVCDDPVYEQGQLYRCCDRSLSNPSTGAPEVIGALQALDGLLADSILTSAQLSEV